MKYKKLRTIDFKKEKLNNVTDGNCGISINDVVRLTVIFSGKFKDKAIHLPFSYDYTLGINEQGKKILVPTKK